MADLRVGYVVASSGRVYVQGPHDDPECRTGFALFDEEQSWPGARELGEHTWELVTDDDPRVTAADRARLGWVLEKLRAST